MRFLDHKIPPPLVLVLVGLGMWYAAWLDPNGFKPNGWRLLVIYLSLQAALPLLFSAVRGFRRAGTTPNPLSPEKASTIVTGGMYRFTRNPMYLAFTLLLVGWAGFLWSLWAVPGPLVFVLYITRFQIIPEERILTEKFGAEYLAYRASVRRWI